MPCRRSAFSSSSPSYRQSIRKAGRVSDRSPCDPAGGQWCRNARAMDGTALVVCDGFFDTANGKTAHGLVRGTERYRVLGVVDAPTAGRDAGEVLDGRKRGIPIFASIPEALRVLGDDSGLLRRRRGDLGRPGHARPPRPARRSDLPRDVGRQRAPRVRVRRSRARRRGRREGRVHHGRPEDREADGSALLERRHPRGPRSPHRRSGDRLRPRQEDDGPLSDGGLPASRSSDRAHLHGPDRLDAGRALWLHLRFHSERFRLGRAGACRRLLLEERKARPHPLRGTVGAAQSFGAVRIRVPAFGRSERRHPPARAGPRVLRRARGAGRIRADPAAGGRDRFDSKLWRADAGGHAERRASGRPQSCAPTRSAIASSSGFRSFFPLEDGVEELVPLVRDFVARETR